MTRPRAFFLETTPDEGPPRLVPQDKEHALKVLKVRPGDVLLGLDGRGQGWPLEVQKAERRRLQLRSLGPPTREPAPGNPGSPLPWIEVWAPLPKRERAEALLGQLTQLGLARFVPLVTAHTEAQARELPDSRKTRLLRTAQESLKQCGRLWMPEIGALEPLESVFEGPARTLVLDPSAEPRLSHLLAREAAPERPTQNSPLRLLLGPEGGLSHPEIALLVQNGASLARLSPHILRIETAAASAFAICAEFWM